MKAILQFVRTTLLGGLLFLVPLVVLLIILGKAVELARKVVEPLVARLPFESLIGLRSPLFLSVAVLVLLCFIAGLIARMALARRVVRSLETTVLSYIPGYEYIKDVSDSVLGTGTREKYPVVFARVDEYWQLAFQVDRLDNGLVVVYVPDSPKPSSGAVYYIPPERIAPTDLTLTSMLTCVKCLGSGSNALLRGIHLDPSQDPEEVREPESTGCTGRTHV